MISYRSNLLGRSPAPAPRRPEPIVAHRKPRAPAAPRRPFSDWEDGQIIEMLERGFERADIEAALTRTKSAIQTAIERLRAAGRLPPARRHKNRRES